MVIFEHLKCSDNPHINRKNHYAADTNTLVYPISVNATCAGRRVGWASDCPKGIRSGRWQRLLCQGQNAADRQKWPKTPANPDHGSKDYGSVSKSFTRFYTPADIDGTAFLTWENNDGDDDQFLYLPALRRVRRVVSNQKKNRFVNTDFTYEDLQRRKVDQDTHRILKTETYDDRLCWVLESIPVENANSQYSRRVSWVAQDLYIPLKVEFYDKRGRLVKQLLNRNLKKIDGFWTVMDAEMQDLNKKTRTLMRISEIKYNRGIPDRVFTKEYMMHGN